MTTIWTTIKQAIRGERVDYTNESLDRAVVLLAIPMVIEMGMESIFAVVDAFWVSSLGADAIAAVGTTEAMMTAVYALAMGLAAASAAVVARRIGEKDADGAGRAAVQAILIGTALAATLGLVGGIFGPHLLGSLGASPTIVHSGGNFTRVMMGGNITVVLLFLINAVFRGAGDAAIAMRTLVLANALNIILGPCFIFGWGPFPRMGVTGAAVATTIGRGCGVLFQLYQLTRASGKLAVLRKHLRVDWPVITTIMRLGANTSLQALISTTSWIGLMFILEHFGAVVVAGYTLAVRVIMFAILPAWGLSNAAATLVGQNLGAKKPDRAEKAVWTAARYDLIFLGAIGLIFFLFPGSIIGLFRATPEVIAVGTKCLRIVAIGFPLYAYGLVITSAFNGAGDTWVPTCINFFCFWLWMIPVAALLAWPFGLGEVGAFAAVTIAFSTIAVVSVIVFRTGRWKTKAV